MARMPDGTLTYILTAQGAGENPVYAEPPVAEVGGLYGMNVETLTANKTLTVDTDEIYQYFDEGGANRIITLSTVGASAGDRFVIRHNGVWNDIHHLEVKQDAASLDKIYSSAVKEFIFDGTNWISRGIGTGEVDPKFINIGIGKYAQCYGRSIAIGYDAQGHSEGVSIGYGSRGYTYGVAVGRSATAYNFGFALGMNAYGYDYGIAIGYAAQGRNYSLALGYHSNTGGRRYSLALGCRSACERYAETAINIDGGSPQKNLVTQGRWSGTTTNATPTEIFLGALATRRFKLRKPKSALAFKGTVVAQTEATAGTPNVTSSWKVEGLIKRDADGNTTMVGVTHAVIAQDGGAAAWNAVFSADDVNEALILTVTGAADTTIHWAARIDGVETVW